MRLTPWKVPPAKPHHAATDVDREDDTAPGNHSLGTKKGLHSNERLDDRLGQAVKFADFSECLVP